MKAQADANEAILAQVKELQGQRFCTMEHLSVRVDIMFFSGERIKVMPVCILLHDFLLSTRTHFAFCFGFSAFSLKTRGLESSCAENPGWFCAKCTDGQIKS